MSPKIPVSAVDTPEAARALESLLVQKFGAGWIVMELHAYRAADRSVRYYRARLIRRGVRHRPGFKPCFQSLRQEGLRWSLGEPPLPPQGRLLFNLGFKGARVVECTPRLRHRKRGQFFYQENCSWTRKSRG